MHATRQLVFPSGPIDVTGAFQVESEAISNAGRFLDSPAGSRKKGLYIIVWGL
jgi:hypothetical protein